MSVDATALFIPGYATVFHGAPLLALPATPLTAFSLTGTPPTGWSNLGHTSKQNVVNFSKEGGEATKLDTMLAAGVRTIYSSDAWTLNVPALQWDEDILDLAFNGDIDTDDGYIVPASNEGVDRALFVLFQDGTGKLGFYLPSTSNKLADAPSISDTTQFSELPIAAAIQSVDSSVIPAVDGKPAIMKIFKSGLEA